jgi:hypothetical protein
MQLDTAEKRFSWLVRQRGYRFWYEDRLEEKIEVRGRRPDFYVETPFGDFLAEIESFKAPGPYEQMRNRVGVISSKAVPNRMRTAVRHAAAQLKPYADLAIPLVVVLDNWRQVGILLKPIQLVQVFGNVVFRAPVLDGGSRLGEVHKFHDGNRCLTDQHRTYVSAVAVNIPSERYNDVDAPDDMSRERPMNLRVLHNPYATCPLPVRIFSDDNDEHIRYEDGKWVSMPGNTLRWGQ